MEYCKLCRYVSDYRTNIYSRKLGLKSKQLVQFHSKQNISEQTTLSVKCAHTVVSVAAAVPQVRPQVYSVARYAGADPQDDLQVRNIAHAIVSVCESTAALCT